MPHEAPYRIALVVILCLTGAIGGFHRWQAAKSGEKISHKAEGYLFAALLRMVALVLWLSVLAYLISPRLISFAAMPLPAWLRWCGGGGGLLGACLMLWTMSTLGKNLTDTVVVRKEATLVTHGPYRWVRHPFYVTAAVLMASVTVLTANWLIGLTSVIVLAFLAVRTPREEQMLLAHFGDDYRRYMLKTGRFIPRLFR
jgi:protein-S-isoprenylcysteine O-methyltransferase Ste14